MRIARGERGVLFCHICVASRLWLLLLCLSSVSADWPDGQLGLVGHHAAGPLLEHAENPQEILDRAVRPAVAVSDEESSSVSEILQELCVLHQRYETPGFVAGSSILRRLLPKSVARAIGLVFAFFSHLINSGNSPEEQAALRHGSLQSSHESLASMAERGNVEAMFAVGEFSLLGNYSYPLNWTAAHHWLTKVAQATGNATAQSYLGLIYSVGAENVPRNQGLSLLYHTFAASAGNMRSEMACGYRHLMGIGTPKNCQDSVLYYKSAADRAMAFIQAGPPGGPHFRKHARRLVDDEGGMYGAGTSILPGRKGLSGDSSGPLLDFVDYLVYMAEKGDVNAQFHLARLYYDGSREVPQNFALALRYFGNIARARWTRNGQVVQGSDDVSEYAVRTVGYLGRMHLRGEGVQQNFDRAFMWFKRGVEHGDMISQNGLGEVFKLGKVPGGKPDFLQALQYFKAAAEQDYAPAQVNLGEIYMEQGRTLRATKYFERAAHHGNVEAFYHLAEVHHFGIGREPQCGIAVSYYKIVAERVEVLHSPFAKANEDYATGDDCSALLGYLIGAEQGFEAGQINVAYLLELGRRTPLQKLISTRAVSLPTVGTGNMDELAFVPLYRSAKQASVDSMTRLGDYLFEGKGVERNMRLAYDQYQSAAAFHSAIAMWNIGWMHENGFGVVQDFQLAKRFYDQALEKSSEAYLPVKLSIVKLRVRALWNTMTGSKVNGIKDSADKRRASAFTSLFKEVVRQWRSDETSSSSSDFMEDGGDTGDYDGEGEYAELDADEVYDESIVQSIIILSLFGAIAVLLWIRNLRVLRFQEEQRQREPNQVRGDVNNPQNENPPAHDPGRGLFPEPDRPDYPRWLGGAAAVI